MQGVRALADEFGIVLILDEVMSGFGRTGSWFAFEQDGIVPDLVTFAKGVNAGYVPAGGVLISEPIARHFDDHFFAGGLTYSGHPLAMAAIVATIDAMKEEKIVENAATIGNGVLRQGWRRWRRSTLSSARCAGVGCSRRWSWSAAARAKRRWRPPIWRRSRGINRGRTAGLRGGKPHPRGAAVHHQRRAGRQRAGYF